MTTERYDAAKEVLSEGDRVAYSKGGRCHAVYIGVVEGFTPKMVKLKVGNRARNVGPHNLIKLYNQGDNK